MQNSNLPTDFPLLAVSRPAKRKAEAAGYSPDMLKRIITAAWQVQGYSAVPTQSTSNGAASAVRMRKKREHIRQERMKSQIAQEAAMVQMAQTRLAELDNLFWQASTARQLWPQPVCDRKQLYADFYNRMDCLSHNIVCASCGTIHHENNDLYVVAATAEILKPLAVDPSLVPFPFSCGLPQLDTENIMIDPLAIDTERMDSISICKKCYADLLRNSRPPEALANYRWVGPRPSELEDLTWAEEALIARSHMFGRIFRLEARRGGEPKYSSLKGHIVLVPQNTMRLLDILPMSPSSLHDLAHVVWVGKAEPDLTKIKPQFTVHKNKVIKALTFLKDNHEDYKNVRIDVEELDRWPSVFITETLLSNIGRVRSGSPEDAERDGFATEDIDTADFAGDIPITSSAVVDTNNISRPRNIMTLERLESLSENVRINVVPGTSILEQYETPSYFTSAFPTLFPWGTGKHKDDRRTSDGHRLSLRKWTDLLLRDSSRRFQAHADFVFVSFDHMRREKVLTSVNIRANRQGWDKTRRLLKAVTTADIEKAIQDERVHRRITHEGVKTLLKEVGSISMAAPGSDEKKGYALTDLKSSFVYYGTPTIYLTINPADRYSPLALLYAGVTIDPKRFIPEEFSYTERVSVLLLNPLAVIEYFHNMVSTIIETVIKRGMFGKVVHHYGTIEYQGRGTPHMHMALWLEGTASPSEMREKAKINIDFQQRLLAFIAQVASETLPPEPPASTTEEFIKGSRCFQPLLDPTHPHFDSQMQIDVHDIVKSRNMHSKNHTATCFKYGRKQCRARFPRKIVTANQCDVETGIIQMQRDDAWLNNYNQWFSIMTHGNHDCQFLLTKDHAISIIYYILKYISKTETAFHTKLAIAAAVRAAERNYTDNKDATKTFLTKIANKLETQREVGMPEALSHLLDMPDHRTDATFVSIHSSHIMLYGKKLCDQVPEPLTTKEDDCLDAEIIKTSRGFNIVSQCDDYAYRGETLLELCLFDYISLVYKQKHEGGVKFATGHPQHSTHQQFVRHAKPAIPRILGRLLFVTKDAKSSDTREEYYCMVSLLFIPWSHLQPHIPAIDGSWEAYYHEHITAISTRLLWHIGNLDLLHRSKEDAIVDAIQQKVKSATEIHRIDNADCEEEADSHEYYENEVDESLEDEAMVESIIAKHRDANESQDWYVNEALDANLDAGFLPSSHMQTRKASTIHYCDIPVDEIMRSVADIIQHETVYKEIAEKKPREPRVFITGDAELQAAIQSVRQKYTLNSEQGRVLRIIAEHSMGVQRLGPQLLMGIFGEGGTGKSTVVEAIKYWFHMTNQSERLLITATTGAAAAKVRGNTLHSAAGIAMDTSDSEKKARSRNPSDKEVSKWSETEYIIIDEVSMMDCKLMMTLNTRLNLLRGYKNDDLPFGGINLIFIGDFYQLPAVSKLDLWRDSKLGQWEKGHRLWRSLNAAVTLVKQMRQADDPKYAGSMSRIRIHEPTDDDIELLKTRVSAAIHESAPIIVRRHAVRHALNLQRMTDIATKTGIPIIHCEARISKRKGLSIREALSSYYNGKKTLGDGILSLIPNAPLVVTKNLKYLSIPDHPVVNGSIVEFYGFYNAQQQHTTILFEPPDYILVKLRSEQTVIQLPGLPRNVVPIKPESFRYNAGHGRWATLVQFPVVLAYAISDYKCQGQTYESCRVDITKPSSGSASTMSPYVQLSRCRSLHSLSILRRFDPEDLRAPIPEQLEREIEWEASVAEATLQLYPDIPTSKRGT